MIKIIIVKNKKYLVTKISGYGNNYYVYLYKLPFGYKLERFVDLNGYSLKKSYFSREEEKFIDPKISVGTLLECDTTSNVSSIKNKNYYVLDDKKN